MKTIRSVNSEIIERYMSYLFNLFVSAVSSNTLKCSCTPIKAKNSAKAV